MALDDEIKRKQAEDALKATADDDTSVDTDPEDTAAATDDTEEPATDDAQAPAPKDDSVISAPATKKGAAPSYVLVPADQVAKAQPAPDTDKAQPQPQPQTFLNPATGNIEPIQTQQIFTGPEEEGGQRYVVDPDTGQKIPHAELATDADKATQPPEGILLPKVDVTGTGALPKAQPAVQPVASPATAPVTGGEGFWGGDLSQGMPGAPPPDGTEYQPYWPKADKDVKLLPPGVTYIDPQDQSVKTTPGTPRAKPVVQPVAQQPVQPPATQPPVPKAPTTSLGMTPDEYISSLGKNVPQGTIPTAAAAATTTAGAPPPSAGDLNINTDYTAQPGSYAKGRPGDGTIKGIILHSTDADEASSLQTLTTGGVSAHYFVTKDGRIYNLVNDADTAYHAGVTKGPYANYNNSNTIGIEQEHYDPGGKGGANGEAWSPAQVAATSRLVAYLKAKYNLSDNDIMGHSDIAPERKQDPYNYPWQGFFKSVDSYSGTAPTAATTITGATTAAGTTAATTGEGYITGRMTTFGHFDPEDPGVGAPHLGKLNTNDPNLMGVAVPEDALRYNLGNNPAAWRKARVDIIGPNGQHVLVPIVDIGPGPDPQAKGIVADATYGLGKLLNHDDSNNYQFRIVPNAGPDVNKDPRAFADEQAAIATGKYTGPQAPVAKPPSYVLAPMPAAESVSADQARSFDNANQLSTLNQLSNSTPNLPALMRTLDQPIDGVSDQMRQNYAANAKAEATKVAQEQFNEPDPQKAYDKLMSGVGPVDFTKDVVKKIIPNFGEADVSIARFLDSADEKRVNQFIDALGPNATTEVKSQEFQNLVNLSPEQRGPAINALIAHTDPTTAQAIGDPGNILDSLNRVADPKYQAARTAAIAEKQNWVNNSLQGDPRLTGTPAQFISDQLGALPKNVFEALLPPGARETAFYAETYTAAKAQLARDNPGMSDAELDQKANLSATAQLVPQEVLMHAIGGKLGAITAGIENPVQRVASAALVHTAIGAGAGGAQQVAANVVAGKPALEGVPEAAAGGAIQAAPGGIVAGVHGEAPEEAPEEAPVRPTVPKATEQAPLGQAPVTPPPETGRAGGAVRGAEATTMATGGEEATRAPVQPEAAPVMPQERTAPVTQEPVPSVPTDQLGQVQPTPEAVLPHEPVQPQTVGQITPEQVAPHEPVQPSQAIPSVGEAEPWVSKIANRFTAERMANGEIGPVEPGVGVTKEEMLARGVQMGPEEINQHVSNVMNDVGGNPRDQAAAIRTEEARLSQVSRQASIASEADPTNQQLRIDADNAFKDVTDFHNGPVAKLKNDWHAQGMTLQGEIPVDLSTYNGLRDAYLRDVGKPPPPEMEPVLRRTAQRVRDAATAEAESMQRLGAEIDRQSARRPLPSDDQVRENIIKRMKVQPCPT